MKKILCIFMCLIILGGCNVEKIKDVKKEPLEISGFNTIIKSNFNKLLFISGALPYKLDINTDFYEFELCVNLDGYQNGVSIDI